jgi:hypothetical protein
VEWHSFERWCLSIKPSDVVEQHLPPIDVTMVWHAYLLNPRQVYLPSCLIRLPFVAGSAVGMQKTLHAFLSSNISPDSAITSPPFSCVITPSCNCANQLTLYQANPDLLTSETQPYERVSAWERRTQTPYDPFASIVTLTHKPIHCPGCSRTVLARMCLISAVHEDPI